MDFKNPLTPQGFLSLGGVILVLVGVLGYFLIGPTPEASIFGDTWWFDNAENVAHIFLGVVALLAANLLRDAGLKRWLVLAVGALGLFVGVYNLVSPELLGANLEVPLDTALHVVVGVWGLLAGLKPATALAK